MNRSSNDCVCSAICAKLWFLLCLSATVDTRLFVYSSLSQSLLAEFPILFIDAFAIVHAIGHRQRILSDVLQWAVVTWGIYLLCHANSVSVAEDYRLTYLLLTLSLLLSLPYLLRVGLLRWSTVVDGILLIGGVQIVWMTLQAVGIVPSANDFFDVTGSNENPNATAMLLAAVLPLSIMETRRGRHHICYAIFSLVCLVFLLVLQCRSAFLGLLVFGLVRSVGAQGVRMRWRNLPNRWKMCIVAVVAVFFAAAAMISYHVKQDSADGRLLVWKLSAAMIRENPQGVGIGLFEKAYNLRQADYFASGCSTAAERHLASAVAMAYNDFLEHGVSAGFVGLLFSVAVCAMLLRKAYRACDFEGLGLLSTFVAMASVNFFCAAVQPWLVALAVASRVVAVNGQSSVGQSSKWRVALQVAALLLCGVALYCVVGRTGAQMALYRLEAKSGRGEKVCMADAAALQSHIGTSEAYWRFMSRLYYADSDYDSALSCALKAAQYTSAPSVFLSVNRCYRRIGVPEKGLRYLQTVRWMLPHNLTVREGLLDYYIDHEMTSEASAMAREIMNMPIKVKSERADRIRRRAMEYLDRQSTEKQ